MVFRQARSPHLYGTRENAVRFSAGFAPRQTPTELAEIFLQDLSEPHGPGRPAPCGWGAGLVPDPAVIEWLGESSPGRDLSATLSERSDEAELPSLSYAHRRRGRGPCIRRARSSRSVLQMRVGRCLSVLVWTILRGPLVKRLRGGNVPARRRFVPGVRCVPSVFLPSPDEDCTLITTLDLISRLRLRGTSLLSLLLGRSSAARPELGGP